MNYNNIFSDIEDKAIAKFYSVGFCTSIETVTLFRTAYFEEAFEFFNKFIEEAKNDASVRTVYLYEINVRTIMTTKTCIYYADSNRGFSYKNT